MILNRFLAVFPLACQAFATNGKGYLSACREVEAAISNTSKVYYPGEYE